MLHRMRRRLLHLIRPIPPINPPLPPRIRPLPLLIRIPKLKLPHHTRQYNLKLRHHNALRNTVPRPILERAPGILDREQLMRGVHEPAFGEEVVGGVSSILASGAVRRGGSRS